MAEAIASPPARNPRLFPARGSYAEAVRIGQVLRKETVGGALLVVMAVIVVVCVAVRCMIVLVPLMVRVRMRFGGYG